MSYDLQYPDSVKIKVILTGTSSFYDLTGDVMSTIHGEYGFSGNSYDNLVAQAGYMEFVLNNSAGQYTFNNSNTLAGWAKGIRVICTVTYRGIEWYEFAGYLEVAEPDVPIHDIPTVKVTVDDWLQKAARFPLRKMTVLTNSKIGDGVSYLVNLMPTKPTSQNYDTGVDTFPSLFDGILSTTVAMTEFRRLALSEFAPIYLRMVDNAGGEQLRAESRGTRIGSMAYAIMPTDYDYLLQENGNFIYTESGVPLEIDKITTATTQLPYKKAELETGVNLLNEISARAYPRRIDTTPQTLFTLQYPITLPPNTTQVNVKGQYTDPNGGGTKVNADPSTMQPLVTGTHYQMWSNISGTGTDLTAALQISYTFGSEGVTFNSISNTGTQTGYVTRLKAIGYGTYFYEPIDYFNYATGTYDAYGVRTLMLDQKYQNNVSTGQTITDILIARETTLRTRISKMYYDTVLSVDNMYAFLALDIGDRVSLDFEGTNLSVIGDYIINRKIFDIYLGGTIEYAFEYAEFLPLINAYWELGTVGKSELGSTTYIGV